MLADVLGREIETVECPQNAGAVGAALVAAIGLGIIRGLDEAKKLIRVTKRYVPDMSNKAVYDRTFEVFKSLYKSNIKNFFSLNECRNEMSVEK